LIASGYAKPPPQAGDQILTIVEAPERSERTIDPVGIPTSPTPAAATIGGPSAFDQHWQKREVGRLNIVLHTPTYRHEAAAA
jgi:hypothetical protein